MMGIEYFQNLAKLVNFATSVDEIKSEAENLKSLGSVKTDYHYNYNPSLLESFENPQTHTPYEIEITAPEVTCLCPKTGQPDFATICIRYSPDRWCIESKSLKLYLGSFRSEGIFHEAMVNRIARDLNIMLDPLWIEVIGKFAPRGGISFHPKVMLRRKEK
jgi:7-cyano-7-deazaguanine reductase